MEIKGAKIVLTGAGSGIGAALLRQLCFYDCQIIAADVNEANLQEVIRKIGILKVRTFAKIIPFVGDISQAESIDQLFSFAVEKMQGIDIFVANAGFAYYEKLGNADWQHTEKIFQLNVFSPIYSFQKLRDLNSGKPYYFCITASAMAFMGLAGYALYGATKAALERFADAYYQEKDDRGCLGLVYPVSTKTGFFQQSNGKIAPTYFPAQTAYKVAAAMVSGIKKNKKRIFPSFLFRISYLFGSLQNILNTPYQLYAKRLFRKWLNN